MTLSPAQTRWIALIRYQTSAAIEQSQQPMPLAMLAINGLQDAVEALLGLVVEHRKLTVKGKDFSQLFDAVGADVPAITNHRTAVIALNSARVGYKHHGNVLDAMSIERHRASVQTFLTDLAREGLHEDFDAVGVATLINNEGARRQVEMAGAAWADGDTLVAMARLRIAFDQLVTDARQTRMSRAGYEMVELLGSYLRYERELRHLRRTVAMLDEGWSDRPPADDRVPRRVGMRLSAEQQQALIREYEAGASGQELAERYGVARSAVIQFLRGRGVTVRRRRLTKEELAQIVTLYRDGVRQIDIAERGPHQGCSPACPPTNWGAVGQYLKDARALRIETVIKRDSRPGLRPLAQEAAEAVG